MPARTVRTGCFWCGHASRTEGLLRREVLGTIVGVCRACADDLSHDAKTRDGAPWLTCPTCAKPAMGIREGLDGRFRCPDCVEAEIIAIESRPI